jgi:phenylpyruvate tautomerase PptA (4-oxalocrotonate tautomerase family)
VLPPQGLLTKAAKTQIAEEIASIHCDATGAPRSFVNVLFLELPMATASWPAANRRRARTFLATSATGVTSKRDKA